MNPAHPFSFKISRSYINAFISITLFICLGTKSFSVPKNWTGNVNNDWNLAANWTGGVLPVSTSNIIIDPVNFTGAQANPLISSNSTFTVSSVSIANGASLTINADLSSAFSICVNPTLSNSNTQLIITGGTITIGSDLTADNDGSCNISGGNILVTGATCSDHGGILNMGGTVTLTTGTLKCLRVGNASSVINMTGGTVTTTFAGNSSLLLDGGNIPGSAPRFSVSGGNLTVAGLTQFFTSSTNDSPILENSGGKIIFQKAVKNPLGAKMTFNISGGTTYFEDGISTYYTTDIITQTGGSIQFDNTGPWINAGTYSATGGVAIFNSVTWLNNFGTGTWNFHDIIINTGKTFNQNNTSNINVAGDWTNNGGNYIPSGKQVTFNGSTTQNISGDTFCDVEFNESGNSVLTGNVIITHALKLTSGIVTTSVANLLTLNNNATSTIGSPISFVDGPMLKIGNNPFIFPIGNDSTWARLSISGPSLSTDKFSAQYFHTGYGNYTTTQVPSILHHVSQQEYWVLDRVEGTSDVKITLYWENPAYSAITSCSDLRLAHWNGAAWENDNDFVTITSSGCPNPISQTGSIMTSTVATFYGPFTFASKSGANALPIELTDFTAAPVTNTVVMSWTTATEFNNNYFTIERSQDGVNFSLIGDLVPGAGTSSLQHSYTLIDKIPFPNVSFYRLKQTNFDGDNSYSNLVKVDFHSVINSAIEVFPNPANVDDINVSIKGLAHKPTRVILENEIGQVFYSQNVLPDNDDYKVRISGNENIKPDVYFILVSTDQQFFSKKMVVN